jgi:hypothetical protein
MRICLVDWDRRSGDNESLKTFEGRQFHVSVRVMDMVFDAAVLEPVFVQADVFCSAVLND